MFLEQNPPTFRDVLFEFRTDCMMLIYDVFNFLNNFNLALQGENVIVFKVQKKVKAAIKKFNLWSRCAKTRNYKAFTTLTTLQKENNMSFMPHDTSSLILEHL